MKLLLDTHAFIWWSSEPTKLSPVALLLCQDRANVVLLSVASVWEMQIKHQFGKLNLTILLREMIADQQQANNIDVLMIVLTHVLELENLPNYHRDPFGRILIAQANVENAVLLSHDKIFENYPVKLMW